jgi:ABC-type dipeptide/oligopeptide/nickel transport system permease component
MIRFIIIRILQAVVAIIGIAVLVFFMVRASGDPLELMKNPNMTEGQYEAMKANLGLDKSYTEQFWIFMGDLFTGDLGTSLLKQRPVADMIGESLPNTLKLTVPAFVLSMLLAFFLGVMAATRRDSFWDQGVKFLAVLGQALPGFWLAIIAMLIFTVYWPILPVPSPIKQTPLHYVLPVATQMFFMLPGMMRLVRSTMLDVLDSEYVKLARIKGLPERVVIWKHALRNAMITPLTTLGMIIPSLVLGAVITEVIFNWPGMGRMILESTFSRDFTVVQTITVLTAILVLVVNLLVDISYAYVDPQIRYQRS